MTGLDINKFNFKKPYQFNTAVVLRTNVVCLNYCIKHLKQFRALNSVSDVELVTAIACQVPQVIETYWYLQVKSRKILSMKIGISYPFHQACTTHLKDDILVIMESVSIIQVGFALDVM